jgi:hypothetical protein
MECSPKTSRLARLTQRAEYMPSLPPIYDGIKRPTSIGVDKRILCLKAVVKQVRVPFQAVQPIDVSTEVLTYYLV